MKKYEITGSMADNAKMEPAPSIMVPLCGMCGVMMVGFHLNQRDSQASMYLEQWWLGPPSMKGLLCCPKKYLNHKLMLLYFVHEYLLDISKWPVLRGLG